MNRRRLQFCRSLALVVAVSLAVTTAAASAATKHDNRILSKRPLAPKILSRQHPHWYPNAPAVTTAPGPGPNETAARQLLSDYLADEFPHSPHARAAALAIYDSPVAKQKVPAPSARAALAALRGTIGEPAIAHILTDTTAEGQPSVTEVTYGDLGDTVFAQSIAAGTGQKEIVLNNDYTASDPFLFTALLAHESLHQDEQSGSTYEEAAATSFESLIYLDQLTHHRRLTRSSTGLGRYDNTVATLRLNSGKGAHLGLFAANHDHKVLPGSAVDYRSFWDAFSKNLVNTDGNSVLKAYLANTHVRGAPKCSARKFSRKLLKCIDANKNDGLSPHQLITAAHALGLHFPR
jgi:hypothetical protein